MLAVNVEALGKRLEFPSFNGPDGAERPLVIVSVLNGGRGRSHRLGEFGCSF